MSNAVYLHATALSGTRSGSEGRSAAPHPAWAALPNRIGASPASSSAPPATNPRGAAKSGLIEAALIVHPLLSRPPSAAPSGRGKG